ASWKRCSSERCCSIMTRPAHSLRKRFAKPWPAPDPGARLFDVWKDLVRLGKAAQLQLGEDALAVHHHLERSAGTDHQLGLRTRFFLDESRQTGGARVVVSNLAVVNFDPSHGVPPLIRSRSRLRKLNRDRSAEAGTRWDHSTPAGERARGAQ